jgi:hypothetical protein
VYSRYEYRKNVKATRKQVDKAFTEIVEMAIRVRASESASFLRWYHNSPYEHLVGDQYIHRDDRTHHSAQDIAEQYVIQTTQVSVEQ